MGVPLGRAHEIGQAIGLADETTGLPCFVQCVEDGVVVGVVSPGSLAVDVDLAVVDLDGQVDRAVRLAHPQVWSFAVSAPWNGPDAIWSGWMMTTG
ncbi:hypothetical protein [Actinokineospora spheciospongiae]|uniref:hypothetical protein n=1 Tax=Actinokineospora spheciospongiae TaxID=909613 RepID=UPI00190F8CC1|nr:hypothetical protein [Actinokineospora spheciospongiae]